MHRLRKPNDTLQPLPNQTEPHARHVHQMQEGRASQAMYPTDGTTRSDRAPFGRTESQTAHTNSTDSVCGCGNYREPGLSWQLAWRARS